MARKPRVLFGTCIQPLPGSYEANNGYQGMIVYSKRGGRRRRAFVRGKHFPDGFIFARGITKWTTVEPCPSGLREAAAKYIQRLYHEAQTLQVCMDRVLETGRPAECDAGEILWSWRSCASAS